MRDRFMLVAAAAVVNAGIRVIIIALTALGVVFITGDLHSSGLTQIPALSFWQSVEVLLLVYLLSAPLRAGRINISKEGKGER